MSIITKGINKCIKCGNKEIKTKDCGYNTFNPGSSTCTSCGNKAEVSDCDNYKPDPTLIRAWNAANPKPKVLLARIDKKIENMILERRRIKNLFKEDLK